MIKIYHNPRCSKSRQGLAIVEATGKPFEVIKYMDDHLTEAELQMITKKLNISPIDLVRKGEAIWKAHYKGKTLSDKEIIAAMSKHPKLIERPVVITAKEAIIGRPPENISSIL